MGKREKTERVVNPKLIEAVLERAIQAETKEHLGYQTHDSAAYGSNSRNGVTRKKVRGEVGEVEIETPCDRKGKFEPQILPKR